jgi:hypothetical protein
MAEGGTMNEACLSCSMKFNSAGKFCSNSCRDNYIASAKAANPLAEFCRKIGIELKPRGVTGLLVGICPLHNEKSESFYVYPDNHFHCYGYAKHGDVVDLCQRHRGISRLEAAEALLGGAPVITITPTKKTVVKAIYQFTIDDINRINQSCRRLASDPTLIQRFCAKRPEWSPEAVLSIALDGDLGYEEDCRFCGFQGPALLFAYSHGVKARWKADNGQKNIRWILGAPKANAGGRV